MFVMFTAAETPRSLLVTQSRHRDRRQRIEAEGEREHPDELPVFRVTHGRRDGIREKRGDQHKG
ncbi:MAG: hypothetical protein IPI81_11445 [Flavobacteriales bacterium]|nr:hypothetical protein [Flavobacteriales bacterium]